MDCPHFHLQIQRSRDKEGTPIHSCFCIELYPRTLCVCLCLCLSNSLNPTWWVLISLWSLSLSHNSWTQRDGCWSITTNVCMYVCMYAVVIMYVSGEQFYFILMSVWWSSSWRVLEPASQRKESWKHCMGQDQPPNWLESPCLQRFIIHSWRCKIVF